MFDGIVDVLSRGIHMMNAVQRRCIDPALGEQDDVGSLKGLFGQYFPEALFTGIIAIAICVVEGVYS